MSDFAPVCPIHIMSGLAKAGLMGKYHLPLAHDVLYHENGYRQLFDVNTKTGSELDHVILDNSVIELGTAVDIKVIGKAAEIVKATVIVLPDVLLDCGATIYNCRKALEEWPRVLDKTLGDGIYTFMVVPQGNTIEEWIHCAEAFADDTRIGWWGIPRNFNIKGLGSRKLAVDIIQTLDRTHDNDRNVHLLGFSDNVLDDILSAQHPYVTGIDSAVPIRAASLGLKMSLAFNHKLPSRGNWWTAPDTVYKDLMGDNLETVRYWIGD